MLGLSLGLGLTPQRGGGAVPSWVPSDAVQGEVADFTLQKYWLAGSEVTLADLIDFSGGDASSFVTTNGITQLNLADTMVPKFTEGLRSLFDGAAGTCLVEVQNVTGNGHRLVASDNSLLNSGSTSDKIASWNGTDEITATTGMGNSTGTYIAGIAWDENGRSICMDGGTVVSDTGGIGDTSDMYLGRGSTVDQFNPFGEGYYNRLIVIPKRLSDTDLQIRTIPSVSYWGWGDSMVSGVGANAGDRWIDKLWGLIGTRPPYQNKGAGGETDTEVLARIVADTTHAAGHLNIVWMSRNSTGDPTTSLANHAAAKDALGSNTWVVSVTKAANDTAGTIANIDTINAGLKTLYGSKYIDVATQTWELGAPDGDYPDADSYALGCAPVDIRYDDTHFNTAGHAIVAQIIYDAIFG